MASRDDRYAVFVTTTGGRTWRLALSSTVLPPGVEPNKPQNSVTVAGCKGKAASILISQAVGQWTCASLPPSTSYAALSLGQVLAGCLAIDKRHPRRPPEDPDLPGWAVVGAISVRCMVADVGVAGDGVVHGHGRRHRPHHFSFDPRRRSVVEGPFLPCLAANSAGIRDRSQQLPYAYRWRETVALNATDAWILFGAPNDSGGDTYLYATSDGGAAWHKLAVFR